MPFSNGRGWDCSQCTNNRGLRRLRGNCGGTFKKGLPQALTDEHGLYMPGYRVAPNSGEAYSDLKIRSCPISNMNRLALIVSNYSKIKNKLLSFSELYPHPTCAIVESIEILDYNHEQMNYRKHKQALEESSHG